MVESEQNNVSNTTFYHSLFSNLQYNQAGDFISVFEDINLEYKTLYDGVGLRDISHFSIIELKGKEILEFLNRIGTCALKDLKLNYSAVTLFTNEKGRIIERSTILNLGESVLLISSNHLKQKIYSWLNKYIIMEDIKIYEVSSQYSIYELIGPQADSFITLVFDHDVNNLSNNQFKKYNVEGKDFIVLKKNEFDINKYWIIAKQPDGMALIKYMIDQKSVFDFRLIGETAYNKYRIERGIPAVPSEINDFYNPHEVGLINEVSFTKGCYIGQEVIARLDTYDKVQKIIKGVVFETSDIPGENLIIYQGKNEVGNVTSVTYSPLLKKNIGLAFIKKESIQNDNILIAKSKEGLEYPITIRNLPFKK
jgi:tRNA-modifying protein YgfZ